MNETEIRYQEVSLDGIMDYYAQGFEPRDTGEEVYVDSWHIDVMKKTVIFKLRAIKKTR